MPPMVRLPCTVSVVFSPSVAFSLPSETITSLATVIPSPALTLRSVLVRSAEFMVTALLLSIVMLLPLSLPVSASFAVRLFRITSPATVFRIMLLSLSAAFTLSRWMEPAFTVMAEP